MLPSTSAAMLPRMIACTAATAARSGSFSPMRRATVAAAPMATPMASAYTMNISDSVSPTVATASAPRRPTKKMSATANTDSISISSTIGTASSTTARPIGACV